MTSPGSSVIKGIEPFDTVGDELYLSEYQGETEFFSHTNWSESVDVFQNGSWEEKQDHAVLYLRNHGKGTVLHLTLGHCRSTHDTQLLVENIQSWSGVVGICLFFMNCSDAESLGDYPTQ